MIESMRWLVGLGILMLGFGGLYWIAGRSAPPQLTIDKPDRVVGQAAPLEVTAQAPNARFTTLTIAVEQNGGSPLLFVLNGGPNGLGGSSSPVATVTPVDRDRVRITRPIGKQSI